MSSYSSVIGAVASVVVCSSSHSAILVFTDQFLFAANTSAYASATEDFNAYSGGYGSPLTGTAGGVNWSASSSGGLTVSAGRLGAASPNAMEISFSGASVYGVSGNFFGTDSLGAVVPSLVLVTLNDGTSYLNLIDTATVFVGFASTGAAISSISITAQAFPSGAAAYSNVDNLGLAYVPAPGALALLGLAGLAAQRRRR